MQKKSLFIYADSLDARLLEKSEALSGAFACSSRPRALFNAPLCLRAETSLSAKMANADAFKFDAQNSQFKKFAYLKFCFGAGLHKKCLFNTRFARRIFSSRLSKKYGFGENFSIENIPYSLLPNFSFKKFSNLDARAAGEAPQNESRAVVGAETKAEERAPLALKTLADDSVSSVLLMFDSELGGGDAQIEKLVKNAKILAEKNFFGLDIFLFSDFQTAEVKGVCDVEKAVKKTRLKFGSDYAAFYADTYARFKYFNPRAKEKIRGALESESGKFASEPFAYAHADTLSSPLRAASEAEFPSNNKYADDLFLAKPGYAISPSFTSKTPPKTLAGFAADGAVFMSSRPIAHPPSAADYFDFIEKYAM